MKRSRSILVAVIGVVVVLAACGDDDDSTTSVTEPFEDSERVLEAMEEAIALHDEDPSLTECGFTEATGGRPYAAGTITNSADHSLTYILTIDAIVDIHVPADPEAPAMAGEGGTSIAVNVEQVPPGETVEWRGVHDLWTGPQLAVDWEGRLTDCTLILSGIQPLPPLTTDGE